MRTMPMLTMLLFLTMMLMLIMIEVHSILLVYY
jgi:hypothetical protein